jgi:hypothetical protein
MVKGYPIGTFIFWKTKEELRYIKDLGNLKLAPTPEGDYINYVLDGQQRLTSLFAILKGAKILREDYEEDYSHFYIDLQADENDIIVRTNVDNLDKHQFIKLHDLLYGKLKMLASYPEAMQEKIQKYKDNISAYPFSSILVEDAPIEVATDIFTRLNVSGKPLTVFEIMVAKTFDSKQNFDLAEKYDQLNKELEEVDYGTIPGITVLQTIAILLAKQCMKKDILSLKRQKVIDIWPKAVDSIKSAVDYFRDFYRIPVSGLLPYPSLVVPFAYYFYKHDKRPTGIQLKYLQDFFWRAALGGRYSQGAEARLAQDIEKIEAIINGNDPKYDWAVDISPEFIESNGWFSLSRSYIKAILCVLAYQQPQSFIDNSIVRISNDWLKQANSKNYHHFFPKAFLQKQGEEYVNINHIANITIVDDFLNKREIRAQAPSKYMKKFAHKNEEINKCMSTHLIKLDTFGIWDDDYNTFIKKRCQILSKELKKRIIEQDIDHNERAIPAEMTTEEEVE